MDLGGGIRERDIGERKSKQIIKRDKLWVWKGPVGRLGLERNRGD